MKLQRALSIIALFFTISVSAAPLKNIVIFGDSLSDNGNLYEYMDYLLPQSPPYYQGRFTNGPVWVERLASFYFPSDPHRHLLDYAFGGAGVSEEKEDDGVLFTLKREIDTYLLSHQDKANPNSLFMVWIGANNYLAVPEDPEEALKAVNKGILHSLEKLAEAGARYVVVVSLPDLGKTPAAIEYNASEALSEISKRHNDALVSSIESLGKQHPEVQWIYFNIGSMLQDFIEHPEKYGFTNTVGTCYEASMGEPSSQSILKMVSQIRVKRKEACDGYVFFDPVHPTAAVHQIMADKAKQVLADAGIEFSH